MLSRNDGKSQTEDKKDQNSDENSAVYPDAAGASDTGASAKKTSAGRKGTAKQAEGADTGAADQKGKSATHQPEGGRTGADSEGSGARDGGAAGEDDEVDPTAADGESGSTLAAERDKYLRLAAEYDNYRKRSVKERETAFTNGRADTVSRLLPVYDNLERALDMECEDEAYRKGIEMTMTNLKEILEGMDVHLIATVGEPFDPNRHNAVMSIENPDLGEKIVAEEFQKGFVLGERVIRHSTVVVAN